MVQSRLFVTFRGRCRTLDMAVIFESLSLSLHQSLPPSLPRSLARSPTHSLTHPLTHPPTHPLTHSLTTTTSTFITTITSLDPNASRFVDFLLLHYTSRPHIYTLFGVSCRDKFQSLWDGLCFHFSNHRVPMISSSSGFSLWPSESCALQ